MNSTNDSDITLRIMNLTIAGFYAMSMLAIYFHHRSDFDSWLADRLHDVREALSKRERLVSLPRTGKLWQDVRDALCRRLG